MLAGLFVFTLVYALLAAPALPAHVERALAGRPFRVRRAAVLLSTRPGIALVGATLLVVAGIVAPRAALAAIDLRTLALLLGMMLLVAALEAASAFALLADRLAHHLPTPRRLLAGSMIAVAVLSALVLNDAVVLLFTPVLVRAARAMGVSPFPFLVGEAFAANLGSVATPVGNPQNAAIALAWDLSFVDFLVALAPLALVGLAVGVCVCLLAFRRELATRSPSSLGPPARVAHPALMVISCIGVGGALVGFLIGPGFGVPLWAIALSSGLVVLALTATTRVSPVRVAKSVDLGILVFFAGLFVLLETVRDAGALDAFGDLLARGGSAGFVIVTAGLSNVVSNVPAVLLLLPIVDSSRQALLLAAASTYAGNATFLGSAATVIVAETARAHGAEFSAWRFTLIGLPLAAVTLVLAWSVLG